MFPTWRLQLTEKNALWAEIQTAAESVIQFSRLNFLLIFLLCLYWSCWDIIVARHAFISIHSQAVNTLNHITSHVSQTADYSGVSWRAAAESLFVLRDFSLMFSSFLTSEVSMLAAGLSFRQESHTGPPFKSKSDHILHVHTEAVNVSANIRPLHPPFKTNNWHLLELIWTEFNKHWSQINLTVILIVF